MAKIKYGLRNVHYAVVTETTNQTTGPLSMEFSRQEC